MKSKAFEWTARRNPQGFLEDPVTNLAAPQLRLAFRHFALLTGLLVPLVASADNWQMQVGAQTGDKAHQALAFLPNEIWIHPGDSITWTCPTSELHSVTFLIPGQIRPSRLVGCPGTNSTPDFSVVDGTACVNSGILMDDATYTVVFPEAGNFKAVCLAHNDQTGTVHVLDPSAPLPHDQAFYNQEADRQRARLISDARNAAQVTTDHNTLIAGAGKIHGTSGGTETASVMRFMDETKVIHVVLAATIVPALPAEPHCPGNVASVPLHLTNSHQMIVAVSVNHSGPYNFLLDTGTQITMVDPSLAAELHLNTQGSAVVAGVGFLASAPLAQLDLLEAGSHAVANQKVLVFDFQNPHSVDLHFRGILGEDFLSQFDMLIDNDHNLLCLDDSSAMAADLKGPHIALVAPTRAVNGMPALVSLIIAARLSDEERPVRLKLDSGTNVSFLFNTYRYMPLGLLRSTSLLGGGDRAQRPVSTMPLQDLQIGSLEIPRVSFVTFADSPEGLSRTSAFDGLLTLGLFRRVFICHTHHFVVLDPR